MVNSQRFGCIVQANIPVLIASLSKRHGSGWFFRRPFNETVSRSFDGFLADEMPVGWCEIVSLKRSPVEFGFLVYPLNKRRPSGLDGGRGKGQREITLAVMGKAFRLVKHEPLMWVFGAGSSISRAAGDAVGN